MATDCPVHVRVRSWSWLVVASANKITLAHLLTLSSDSDLTEEVCGECAAEAAAAAPSFFIHMIKLRVAFGA